MWEFIVVVLRDSTPIMFVALGILVMQLSGVLNIGAEGMMLIGAFAGIVGEYFSGSNWLGVLFSMLIVGLFGLLYGFVTIHLKGNQVVVGVAFNILAVGLTTTLTRLIFGLGAQTNVKGFQPVVGGVTILVFLAVVVTLLLHFFMYKTRPGLLLRATGEHPLAVDVTGKNVYMIQYAAIIAGAMLIAIGGCALTMAQLKSFSEGVTSGRGYIALAAVTLGQFKPLGVLIASLIFGTGNAVQYTLQARALDVPSPILRMLPYLITIIAVVASGRNSRAPAALGREYHKLK